MFCKAEYEVFNSKSTTEFSLYMSMACFFKKSGMPKGYLIAVGGAEDKGEEAKVKKNRLDFFSEGILRQIVELAGKRANPKIELITTASSIPDEIAQV